MKFNFKIAAAITIPIVVFNLAFNKNIAIREYNVNADFINPVKIVMISDLHSEVVNKLDEKIKKLNPDIIFLAGDIFDEINSNDVSEKFITDIKDIAPVYCVFGNHDYWSGEIFKIKSIFNKNNIIFIEDDFKEIDINGNKLKIAGVCDPEKKTFEDGTYNQIESMENAFKNLESNSYNILIAHRPEHIEEYKKYNFNLVVSGHAHGGQIRIPFLLNGLFAPDQGFFPKYAGGLYKHNKLIHIVGRGITTKRPNIPRIFNPPEIVVINLI